MNILFFARLFYPHIGGVEKHVFEISKILIKKGCKIIVFTEQYDTKLKLKDTIQGIEIYRIPVGHNNWFKKFRIWRKLWKYRQLIKIADIVHCHDVFFWYLPFRFWYVKKPVFTTFHGYESYPLRSKFIIMHKIWEKLSVGNICIGDFIKKWYKTRPNFVSYGGTNIVRGSEFKVQSKNSAIFIGRLDEQAGITTYLEAVALIKRKVPKFEFVVIGDGKLKRQVEKKAKVLGFLKDPESYLRQYRFAFASGYLSILEAMSEKRLVFAVFDNPLKEDYLRLAPFAKFINIISSKKELSSLIFYFLDHPDKEKIMVDKAFEWAKIQSWDNVSRLYLDLWRRK